MTQVFEHEKYWVDYSKEELISLVDCADKVCEELVGEVVMDLMNIQIKQDHRREEEENLNGGSE